MTSRDPDPPDIGPVLFQRGESLLIAALATIAFVELGHSWWWLLVLFLVFDLSMVGYAVSPAAGAWTYNVGHSYALPAALAGIGLLAGAEWATFLALAWAFHIGVDRFLGYGLKYQDQFTHTHLGLIGVGNRPPAPGVEAT